MAIAVGARITADDIQDALDAISVRLPIRARCTSALTKNANTTFSDITGLSVSAGANKVYRLWGRISVTAANTTADYKIQIVLPAGATIDWSLYAGNTSLSTVSASTIDIGRTTATSHARGTIAGDVTGLFSGIITMSSTAGTIKLQGAQNTSDPSNVVFNVGSEMSIQEWV